MGIANHYYLIITLLAPLFSGFVSIFFSCRKVIYFIALFCSFFCACIAVKIFINIFFFNVEYFFKLGEVIAGVPLAWRVDYLGAVFTFVICSLYFVNTIYTIGYVGATNDQKFKRLFIFIALTIFASLAVVLSDNLLTAFIFYELVTILTYPLVRHYGDANSIKFANKYLLVLSILSFLFFLPLVVYIYNVNCLTSFAAGGKLFFISSGGYLLFLFVLVYAAAKAAVMPAHVWLPAAMVAPVPVSALLHSVAVVNVGLYVIVRGIFFVLNTDSMKDTISSFDSNIFTMLAAFSVVLSSVFALRQDILKKRLAYSTISQLSYVVLILSVFNYSGVVSAVFHIVGHAFAKILLFFSAGVMQVNAGIKKISDIKGFGRKYPLVMVIFTIAVFSIIGLPLTPGYYAKYNMIRAAYEENNILIIATLIISSILNVCYFLPIIFNGFFYDYVDLKDGLKSTPIMMLLAMICAVLLLIGFACIHYFL